MGATALPLQWFGQRGGGALARGGIGGVVRTSDTKGVSEHLGGYTQALNPRLTVPRTDVRDVGGVAWLKGWPLVVLVHHHEGGGWVCHHRGGQSHGGMWLYGGTRGQESGSQPEGGRGEPSRHLVREGGEQPVCGQVNVAMQPGGHPHGGGHVIKDGV